MIDIHFQFVLVADSDWMVKMQMVYMTTRTSCRQQALETVPAREGNCNAFAYAKDC